MNDPVAHAKSYPFPVPGRSYVFWNGQPVDMPEDGFDRADRTPVLAAGSNQSHEQLARKYSILPGHVEIPVQKGMLRDFDSVYAAHLASYGSVPSTFYPSAGTRVTTYVLWLDDSQLNRMHETERNYTFDHAYTAKIGCVNYDGLPVALAEIKAHGRTLPSMSQPEMLDFVRSRLAPDSALDEFVHAHILDESLRQARTAALSKDAIFQEFPRTVLGDF
jgi:hypothetical protein